ncbi:restriction endonuclease subunit S [uncultured Oscillibacter sp.]|uniref:restriction endonuclease subunit S n=1 Tax=uncultured Oscillibacter sp. TaxID=876091 RepID=UPI0026271C46|nr:restriction endonuclease subunit S [uncultured Oscillibacter sp.]
MEGRIRLGDIFTLVGGGTPSTSTEAYWGNGTPWFSSADISLDGKIIYRRAVTPLGIKNSTTNIVPAQTVVVVTRVGLGKVVKLPCDMCFSQDMQALQPTPQTPPYNESFLLYELTHIMKRVKFQGRGTTISGITKKQLSDVVLYLPSLVEQKRIVARIEELFSQLDASVAELKTAKERLKVYRQAVLKEAFGEVTTHTPFGEIIDARLGKMLDKEKNTGDFHKYLRNINVRWFSFDLSNLLEMRIEADEIEKYSVSHNDLIICEGGEPGRCAVWDKQDSIFYQKALHRVRFLDNSNPRFYMYYLWFSAQSGQLCRYFTGTGIKHLTGQSLSRVIVPTADRTIQDSIVAEIESRLSVCDSIENTVDTALQQAEALRQSILKKAFEGGLM